MKNLIVGCGISGATLARLLAESGEQVVVIDSKEHIAGNIYDYYDNEICVHKYGTHIFHTNNKAVWNLVSRFCKWYPYQHKICGLIDGQIVPIPFNLNTLHAVFPESLANKIEQKLYQKYLQLAQQLPNVYFFGRLGDYKYYDMDKAIARCLDLAKGLK